jgi:predicted alpha/beta-hydrolase family hydrolase
VNAQTSKWVSRSVRIAVDSVTLEGEWCVPAGAVGMVLFGHGSGSSRHSPRNQAVACALQESGTGTLLFDLLTREKEEAEDARDGHLRFNIGLLARRLVAATKWVARQPEGMHLGPGYFGSSTEGAAALVAAAELNSVIDAVVSRGGRPDLAGGALLEPGADGKPAHLDLTVSSSRQESRR